jgi:nucleoid-associated protein YgaU
MKKGIISKAATGTIVLLLAGGCTSVYEWWDYSVESMPQEPVVSANPPVVSANPPAAEPPPRTNPDSSPVATHSVLAVVVPAESVAASQGAAAPSSEPNLPLSASMPALATPESKKDPVIVQDKEAEDALTQAKARLDWATEIGAQSRFPAPYTKATSAYNTAVTAKTARNWQETMTGVQTTLAAVAEIESLLAALQDKDAEDARKVEKTDTKFIPPAEPLHPITPIPENSVKPVVIAPVNREPPSAGSYIVKPGDSYWSIALHIYGNPEQWNLLYKTNKHTMGNPDNPHLLFPGMVLAIPVLSTPVPSANPKPIGASVQINEKEPKLMSEPVVSRPVSIGSAPSEPAILRIMETVPAAQEYTVKAGDSYWSIANHFYGDVQMWKIVYAVNKDRMRNPDNPHLIFPGMVLTIPDFRG